MVSTRKKPIPPPVKPTPERFQIPEHVTDGLAKQEYIRCMKELNGRINALDQSLLADYANTHAECIRLQESVDIEGIKLTGPKGGEYLNPTVTLLMNKRGLLGQLRRDLYFTPKSRAEKTKPTGRAPSILERINQQSDED